MATLKPSPLSLIPQMTFLEFFAGIGLMRMGLEQGGWSIQFANDIDEQKHAMYTVSLQGWRGTIYPRRYPRYPGRPDTHRNAGNSVIPMQRLIAGWFSCRAWSVSSRQRSGDLCGIIEAMEHAPTTARVCSKMFLDFSHRMVVVTSSRRCWH